MFATDRSMNHRNQLLGIDGFLQPVCGEFGFIAWVQRRTQSCVTYRDNYHERMRDLAILAIHLIVTVAKLLLPGGV